MVWFLEAIGGIVSGALLRVAGSIVYRVLAALGIGVASYTGIDTTLGFFKTSILSTFSGMPVDLVRLLSYMEVGVCVNMLFSTLLMRLAFEGLFNGATRMWIKL